MMLSYKSGDSIVNIALKAKTRGHFRKLKENCKIPPILLNFSPKNTSRTVFQHQDKLKLVMPCRGDDYIIREFLVYKMYNIITPKSFRVRLAEITFRDSAKMEKADRMFCFFIEDEDQMATRNSGKLIEEKLAMENTSRLEFTRMAFFQYLIGNTDWSVPFLQNIKLLFVHPNPVYPVPYDFDHSGMVGAPYALPAAELGIESTRQRLYRGYCNNITDDFTQAIGFYNGLRKQLEDVYRASDLIDKGYKKFALKFLDEFYSDVNKPNAIELIFNKPCRSKQRVEIKGLKK